MMKVTHLPAFSAVSDTEYYEAPLISNSGLTAFKNELTGAFTPNFKKGKFASTLRTGQLLHLAVYEPDLYAQQPEYWSAEPEELERIRLINRMAVAAKTKSPVLASFLTNNSTRYEVPIAFELAGAFIKIKPDALLPKFGHDLKSTACKSLEAFINTFDKYGYWRQAYLYRLGAGASSGSWYFTGVSKTEPHQVFLVDVKKHRGQMLAAKKEVLGLIETYLELNPMHKVKAHKYFKQLATV